MAGRATEVEAGGLVEPSLAVRAVSMLVSRCLGSCRCLVAGGWCGLHRLEPAVDEAQGQETWTEALAEAALVVAGSQAQADVRWTWAGDFVAMVLDADDPSAAFRLGYLGAL